MGERNYLGAREILGRRTITWDCGTREVILEKESIFREGKHLGAMGIPWNDGNMLGELNGDV